MKPQDFGLCPICREPMIWYPGHRLVLANVTYCFPDGKKISIHRHWRCRHSPLTEEIVRELFARNGLEIPHDLGIL